MTIDIWSDIMCPFCYIGKRKLETALQQFEHKNEVKVNWHSFQLDPEAKQQPGKDLYDYLAERKGQTREWSVRMHQQVAQTAKAEGLDYNFDKAVIANSFDAHRLIQLAKKHDLGDAAEERLFRAYFTEGRDVADHNTLMQLGIDIGLRAVAVGEMLGNNDHTQDVIDDIKQAEVLGIRGVPFFVIDGRYGISGAQPAALFADGLQKAWAEYEHNQELNAPETNGDVCIPGEDCLPNNRN